MNFMGSTRPATVAESATVEKGARSRARWLAICRVPLTRVEEPMRARTLCMSVITAGIAVIAGCRDNQPGFKAEPSPGGVPSPEEHQAQMTAPGPRVIGVNTSHIDETGKLSGFRIAILATDGFEQSELIEPRQAYANEGAV